MYMTVSSRWRGGFLEEGGRAEDKQRLFIEFFIAYFDFSIFSGLLGCTFQLFVEGDFLNSIFNQTGSDVILLWFLLRCATFAEPVVAVCAVYLNCSNEI